MGILSKLFGGERKQRVIQLMVEGALIIDVRTPGEFKGGHIKGSKNIPLPELRSSISKIKALKKPIIVCCASGMRSAQAKTILEKEGIQVENGGAWRSLQ